MPLFFTTAALWRSWLHEHHASDSELLVGFWKVSSGRQSMTWSESVDEALCFGWIDGVRRRIDDESYSIRFTPRKPSSVWSAVNVAKVEALEASGTMTDAGRAAFALRRDDRTAIYAYETDVLAFEEGPLRADPAAWTFWQAQTPSYRRVVTHWVTSAKRPETREKRLAELVADCAAGLKIKSQRY